MIEKRVLGSSSPVQVHRRQLKGFEKKSGLYVIRKLTDVIPAQAGTYSANGWMIDKDE